MEPCGRRCTCGAKSLQNYAVRITLIIQINTTDWGAFALFQSERDKRSREAAERSPARKKVANISFPE